MAFLAALIELLAVFAAACGFARAFPEFGAVILAEPREPGDLS